MNSNKIEEVSEFSNKQKTALSWITGGSIILIIFYIILCQKLDTDSALIGGPKYLYVQDNVIIRTYSGGMASAHNPLELLKI